MAEIDVPIISLSQADVVAVVRDACIRCGFLVILDHGVDKKIIESMWEATRAFFDSDISVKEAVSMGGE
jgi:isopenicillin N synthase-like dioxygenase